MRGSARVVATGQGGGEFEKHIDASFSALLMEKSFTRNCESLRRKRNTKRPPRARNPTNRASGNLGASTQGRTAASRQDRWRTDKPMTTGNREPKRRCPHQSIPPTSSGM